ncbi:hypothetical protein [Pseudomonas sp. Q1]|uniref:hypothetical protein n=1 Tax=Pseudomonas sp. Q1 TaxID=2202823 RepID=UPI001374D248|nr:hypothetical protein [Pseudomonas sp. Q1]
MSAVMESSRYFDLVETEIPTQGKVSFAHGFFMTVENIEVSHTIRFSPVDERFRMYTEWVAPNAAMERKKMIKALLHIDLIDIPVMIGSAFFFSSVAGVCWSVASAVPSPVGLGIAASICGLAIGKFVSAKARNA